MPKRDRSRAGGARSVFLAFALVAGVVAVSWLIPGVAWRGLAAMEPRQAVQADSQARADSAARAAPPTVPGATIAAPSPAAAPSRAARPGAGCRACLAWCSSSAWASRSPTTGAAIRWRVIAWGLGLQLLFAIFVLRIPAGQALFRWLGDLVSGILGYSYIGSEFVFGELGKQHSSLGVIFAFQLLPAIIFVSALFAILYYLGIMQLVVRAFAVLMSRVMGASGAESLNVAASIFMGQTEAPLTIRPFLPAHDPLGTDDRDDLGDGPHLRLDHGGVHRVRDRGAAPAHRGDHDRAGDDHDGQAVRARDRGAGDLRHGHARHAQAGREPAGRGGAGDERGAQPDAQRDRDAGVVRRAGRAAQRRLRRGASLARVVSRPTCRPCSAGSSGRSRGRWACRGGTAAPSAACSARGWC